MNYPAMCKTVHVIVDVDNTVEPDVPAKGSKPSKPVKESTPVNTVEPDVPAKGSKPSKPVQESTPVPGIIEIIALHVKMSFN